MQLVFIESGGATVQSLISKEVAFPQMAGAGVLRSRLRVSLVVLIAGISQHHGLSAHGQQEYNSAPDHLKGKTMAVSRFGSSSDFATRYALDKFIGQRGTRMWTILEI